MAATLHIQLFGSFHLVCDGTPVTSIDTARLRSLLAYLVLHRGIPQSRQHIAFSFWPDSTEKQAYNNLRNLLYLLRRAWPEVDAFLHVDAKTLLWHDETPFTLDVIAFERLLIEAEEALQRADEDTARDAFEEAIRLYQGELLPGHYDEWILPERERLHQNGIHALERLVQLLEIKRAVPAAIHHARHLVRLDPLREASYRLLMRLHALNQDRAGMVQVYRRGVQTLKDELDLAPEPATEKLYRRLLAAPEERTHEAERSEASDASLALVGRHETWKQLRTQWQRVAAGCAHLLAITGEAGIGKTRLAEELLHWIQRQGIATARAHCYAGEGRLAYAPVVEWLRADAVREGLATLDRVWKTEIARLLPELQAHDPVRPKTEPLTEGWQRRRLFEALARAVCAGGQPILLLIDDLQWCDRDTLEWLRFLLHFAPEARLLIVGTVRTEEVGPLHPLRELMLDLGRVGQITDLVLEPLDPAETTELASQVAGRTLDEPAAERLYRETEGNPLFVVECVRAGLSSTMEDETGLSSPQSSLPPTVQAVITKRLVQLSPATQSVVGLAATIGPRFTFEVLSRASFMNEASLVQALDELWERRIVQMQENDHYTFTHDKLRETAYAEMSPPRRRLLHQRVAEALEATHACDLDAVSAQLAAHYERAGQVEPAVECSRRAARVAENVHAHGEAIRHLTRARALLHQLPASSERDEKELDVLTDLGLVLRFAKGHGASEVGQVFDEARALCEQVGAPSILFAVQRGRWAFHLIRAEFGRARSLGEDLLALGERLDDAGLRLEAGIALGLTHCWHGMLAPAQEHLERSLALYDPTQHRAHAQQYGQDPGVTGQSVQAFVQALLGAPEQALASIREALAQAGALDHPFSRAYALQHAALVHVVRRDAEAVDDRAGALEHLAREHAFAYWIGPSMVLRGWALAARGRPTHGRELLQEGLEMHRTTGARFQSTLWHGLGADACLRAGALDEGLTHADAALKLARDTGEHVWTAELHRTRGELLVQSGNDDEAAASFQQALTVAREQQAQSLTLRAAVSLGRLWHRQGRTVDAHRHLTAIVSAFPEGHDTPDLRDARTLLQVWE